MPKCRITNIRKLSCDLNKNEHSFSSHPIFNSICLLLPKSLNNVGKLYNNLHMLGLRARLIYVFIILTPNFQTPKETKSFLVKFKSWIQETTFRPQNSPGWACTQVLPVWTSCLAFLQRSKMKERLQTQVQTPASVRDSPKPWLSPDRIRRVHLILHGAPVSEPIRDVDKCYQHLRVITYSSTSAPKYWCKRARVVLFRCFVVFLSSLRSSSFLRLVSICPMADGKG